MLATGLTVWAGVSAFFTAGLILMDQFDRWRRRHDGTPDCSFLFTWLRRLTGDSGDHDGQPD